MNSSAKISENFLMSEDITRHKLIKIIIITIIILIIIDEYNIFFNFHIFIEFRKKKKFNRIK